MAVQEYMHAAASRYSDGSGYVEQPVDMLNRLSREGWTLVQAFSIDGYLLRRDARPEPVKMSAPGPGVPYTFDINDDCPF